LQSFSLHDVKDARIGVPRTRPQRPRRQCEAELVADQRTFAGTVRAGDERGEPLGGPVGNAEAAYLPGWTQLLGSSRCNMSTSMQSVPSRRNESATSRRITSG
jgi:hypothetical protein